MRSWVVLFGGAGRQQVLIGMREAGYDVTRVLVPERKSSKLEVAVAQLKDAGFWLDDVKRHELDEKLGEFRGTGLLSIGFPFIIHTEAMLHFPLKLNVHPTLLPRYKGATSGAQVLIDGCAVAGSTVHLLTEIADGGAIVAQSRVPLTKFDTIRSMQRKVYASEPKLVLEALERLNLGEMPREQEDAADVSQPIARKPEDSEIDPSRSLIDLFDEIRACDPDDFPAFFFVEGEKVCIRLWRPIKGEDERDMV